MDKKKGEIKSLISLTRRKRTFLCFLMLIYANIKDMQIFTVQNIKISQDTAKKIKNSKDKNDLYRIMFSAEQKLMRYVFQNKRCNFL